MMLAQAEDLGDGSEDEHFLAQWESDFMGESTLAAITGQAEMADDPPLDEASCDAAKSATKRWWEVWYDWEDGVCKCWGWNGKQETWMTVTNEVNSRNWDGARC